MAVERSIPLASAEKLLHEAGAIRISDGAKQALHAHLLKKAHEIASQAVAVCDHTNRTTLLARDIDLAVQDVLRLTINR